MYIYIYIYIYIDQNLLKLKHKVKWMVKFVKTLKPLPLHTFLPQYN